MIFVLDASAAGTLVLADESPKIAATLRSALAGERVLVPWIWWFEVRNTVLVNERRRRLTADAASGALALLGVMPVEIDASPGEARGLELARAHRLSFYDASYLELAERNAAILATVDSALAKAARAERIGLLLPA